MAELDAELNSQQFTELTASLMLMAQAFKRMAENFQAAGRACEAFAGTWDRIKTQLEETEDHDTSIDQT